VWPQAMTFLGILILGILLLFPARQARSDSDAQPPDDPAREMLVARFQSVQDDYRRAMKTLALPPTLGLSRADLLGGIDHLHDALLHWKIQFEGGNAALSVHLPERLLSVNPQSMQDILEQDDYSLLHESVHLTDPQIQRQLYGLHAEFVFMEWLQDHLDEDKADQAESHMSGTLSPDDVLRLKLWSPDLKTDPTALTAGRRPAIRAVPPPAWGGRDALPAAAEAFRQSWICEIQAYDVQMMAFNRFVKHLGGPSLKREAALLEKTMASEGGAPSDLSMGFGLFESFNPGRVTDGFQEAVLSCVLMNAHKALIFQTVAEMHGWNLKRAVKDAAYRRQLYSWARRNILRWDHINTDPHRLTPAQMDDLRQNGLIDKDSSL